MSLSLGSPFSHCLELNSLCELLHASALEPLIEILALADIKSFELVTTVNNGLDPDPSNSNTSSDRQITQFKKVKADAAK